MWEVQTVGQERSGGKCEARCIADSLTSRVWLVGGKPFGVVCGLRLDPVAAGGRRVDFVLWPGNVCALLGLGSLRPLQAQGPHHMRKLCGGEPINPNNIGGCDARRA